jgi:hypothetical protein
MSKRQRLLQELHAGRPVTVICGGGSMRGRIEIGQHVTITPIDPHAVAVGDIVFVRWKRTNYMMHVILAIQNDQFLIGNNVGKINGWVPGADVIGKITAIIDPPV